MGSGFDLGDYGGRDGVVGELDGRGAVSVDGVVD